jgi:hypothetical protein
MFDRWLAIHCSSNPSIPSRGKETGQGTKEHIHTSLGYQLSADSRISTIWWGVGGKRKRNGAAVVSKRAARSELTARLFLRFYPPRRRLNDVIDCEGKMGIGWTRHELDIRPLERVVCVFRLNTRNRIHEPQWRAMAQFEMPAFEAECRRHYAQMSLLYGYDERAFLKATRAAGLSLATR